MIEIDKFYAAAGLLPPKEWEVQRLAAFREALFAKIPEFLQNVDFDIPNISRNTGRTTSILIEALHAEWYGYDTVIVFKSVVEQYFAKYRYETLKKSILANIGPALKYGRVTMVTRTLSSQYEGCKVVWDYTK
jgi:hypothetical protein